ncbi:MAG: phage major capsid protein [Planctomycetota bacterium]|jgi:hypothetical protein
MAGETTSTTLTELIQASIGEARVVASQGVDLSTLIVNRPLEEGKGSATFPIYDQEVMAAVNEATDLTNTAFDTTAVTITPGEKGLMTTLTDIAKRRSGGMQAAIDIGRVMGEAYRNIKNTEIYALFDGFSTTIGTTNVDITEALIQQAVGILRAKKAPGPYYMPVTPYVLEDLLGLYSSNTDSISSSLMDSAQIDGFLPKIHGVVPVLVDSLPTGTGTGQLEEADTKTAIFSGQALGFVSEWDFKIETQRDASLRGDEMVATSSFGVGELKDDWGVELLLDNKD